MARRIHYIDWLRVLAVLLLLPFHTSRVFNAGEPFYVKSAHLSVVLSYILWFISIWHMPLLFLLAGASSYFALERRRGGQYAIERVKRLLVPFVFGFFVLIPPQTWYGARFNSGYSASYWTYITSGSFLVWNIHDGGDYYGGFGIGQLWFILWLFVISLVALPLLLWGRGERGSRAMSRFARMLAKPQWWLLAAFLLLLGRALPDPVGKPPFYFLVFFVLGYSIMFEHEAFAATAVRYRWAALLFGSALSVWWVLTGPLRDSMPDPSFPLAGIALLGELGCWLMLVGMMGFGKRWLDQPSAALSYLSEGSYPVYILHQTVIVVAAFYVVQLSWSGPVQWVLLLAIAVVGTGALYEVVRRVGFLRPMLGMRPRRT
jgi:glucans biosynthesis protein C